MRLNKEDQTCTKLLCKGRDLQQLYPSVPVKNTYLIILIDKNNRLSLTVIWYQI
ncbi:hypothetical protein GCM10025794_24130 [Massilia kyonggiensis]